MMRRPVLLILALIIAASLFACSSKESSRGPLRFDGVYYSYSNNICYYLRFYGNGTVVSATVEAKRDKSDHKKIAAWLRSDNKETMQSGATRGGKFELTGDKLKFATYGRGGSVEYEGTASADKMTLNKHSQINNYKGTEVYSFFEVKYKHSARLR